MEKSVAKAATEEVGLGDSWTVVDQAMFPEIAPSYRSKANVNEDLSGDREEKPQTHTKAVQVAKQETNLGSSRVKMDRPEMVQTRASANQAVVHEEIVEDPTGRSSGLLQPQDSVDLQSSNSESESEEENRPEDAAEIARVEEEMKLRLRLLIAPIFPALISGYVLAMYASNLDIPVPNGLILITVFCAWVFGIGANTMATI
ncbi:hypothetical protein PtA15_5A643 [Puccinia triticina]|uniref:SLC41A/MgtE integral membrane domain-containing protein n=1 Tax=Puccinia triticina TaxID=208348 RepID=A0ABY7CIY6_9BASI|nr:uncharacterized protein PtA15_5A643 [Puccinia triticina]WAQ85069.1 hypothetical protein PtA15_5A643 [Puccinia triticina]WAR58400.1 hypothetical protein PtB15_5B634 [Puccinia triticina]